MYTQEMKTMNTLPVHLPYLNAVFPYYVDRDFLTSHRSFLSQNALTEG